MTRLDRRNPDRRASRDRRTFSYSTEHWGTSPDGSILDCLVFPPPGSVSAPAIIEIHEGGFRSGKPGPAGVCQDLADQGYWVIAIPHRLAPPGKLVNQPRFGGRYPGQTEDVAQLLAMARGDARFDGTVYAVAASSGGSHALTLANSFDKVVALSPAIDFNASPQNPIFVSNCINYVGSSDEGLLTAASPAATLASITVPVLLRASAGEGIGSVPGMPPEQYLSAAALIPDVDAELLSGDLHGFKYWSTIKQDVFEFLAAE